MAYPGNFSGVVPPVSTPFTLDGEVDTKSLENLLRYQLDGGVTGIFALGTTSETSALSDVQRTQVIETTVGTVAGQVPVITGVMEMGTAATIEYARQAEALGSDAVVVVGPYYLPYGDAEIMDHFRQVKAAINIPVVAYNIPQMIQTYLQPEVVIQLAQEGVIAGVKDSSGNEPALRKMIAGTRNLADFAVFTGAELTVDYALFAGAAGVVPGLGNVDPAGYRRLYDAAVAEDWDTARKEQARLSDLYAISSEGAFVRFGRGAVIFGSYKTALREMGIIATNAMAKPMQALDAAETTRIRGILEAAGLI